MLHHGPNLGHAPAVDPVVHTGMGNINMGGEGRGVGLTVASRYACQRQLKPPGRAMQAQHERRCAESVDRVLTGSPCLVKFDATQARPWGV